MAKLEDLIARVAPKWAAERAYFRHVYGSFRAYDAARVGRRTDGWVTPGTSANAEIGPAVSRMRARARDLARNTEVGAQAVRKISAHTVGTGINPRLVSEDRAERRRAAERWRAFSESCDPEDLTDFGGKQLEVMQTVVESGLAFVRYLPRPARWGMAVPLQIQILEPDYLDVARNEVGNDGRVIIQGVEFDGDGRRVAHWLFEEHPGDVWPLGGGRLKSRRFTMDEVRPVFLRVRSGQVMGVPWFYPVVMRMRDTADYEEAEHLRKLTEACFAAFVKSPSGAAASPLAGGNARDGAGRTVEKIAPGTIRRLGMGEEITFSTPAAVPGTRDYLAYQWQMTAAGIGLPYATLTGDLTGANYSSLREGKLDFWQSLDVWQWLMLIPQMCRPTWRRVEGLAVATGQVRQVGRADWSTPPRRWVDPDKDQRAMVRGMRSGLVNPLTAIAETTGEDPQDVIEGIAQFNALLDQLEIVLDSDPRRVTSAGVGQFSDPLNPGGEGGNQGGANG